MLRQLHFIRIYMRKERYRFTQYQIDQTYTIELEIYNLSHKPNVDIMKLDRTDIRLVFRQVIRSRDKTWE